MFLTAGARDLLDSAGCQNVKGGWPVQASDRIEAVLEAVSCAYNLQAENRHAPARRNGAQGRGFYFAAGAQPW